MNTLTRRLILAWVIGGCPVSPLAAQGIHYEGGLSLSSGDYFFTERTTTWALATGLSLNTGPFTARITVPAYFQNSTLVAGGGGLPIPTGGSSSGVVADSVRSRKQGKGGNASVMMARGTVEVPSSAVTDYAFALGDPVGALGVRLLDRSGTSIAITGMAKAPLADTATFGTGEWDVGGAIAFTRAVGSRGLLGADVSYWYLGDLPDLELSNPVYGSLSGSVIIGTRWVVGASLSAGTPVIEEFDGPLAVGVQLGRLSARGAWTLHGAFGLSETSPDVSFGLQWRFKLGE